MSIQSLLNELNAVGGRLRRWEAEWRALTGTAAALALLWVFTLSDLFLRYGRAGRVLLWAALLAAVGAAFVAVGRVLRRGFTPEAVAARVEQAFPQLDNHLINTVQFAGRGGADKMVAAYLEREMPDWSTVAVTQLKDRKAQRRALALLAAAGVALLVSALWSGPAWNNALLRIVNPFSQRPPVTLARILEVTPGDSSALAGSAVTLAARIDGKSGQKVFLDLWPADDRKSVVELGRLRGAAEQRFTYNLPKLSTDARYRIRAGDAVSDSYKLKAVTPPSFRKIAVRVSPPAYTGLKPRAYNGLSDTVVVPQGATVEFDLEGDRPLAMATVTVTNHTTEISAAPAATRRGGKLDLLTGDAVVFAITDKAGYSAEAQLRAEFRPDAPPAIKIITPTSRTLLGLGARPRIQWEATDEYGLAEVRLEQITDSEKGTGITVRAWALKGEGTFAQIWSADDPPVIEAGQPLVYRIVALDNGTVGGVRSTRSSPIVFDTVSTAAARKNEEKRVSETADTLSRLTDLQRTNLEKTTKLAPAATNATAEAWNGLRVTQEEIARIASGLLAAPGKPLGALTMVLRDLQEGPMKQVVGVLARAPAAAPAERPALCTQGIALETRILKSLTAVENGAARVAQHRQVTGLLALLDALVAGQEDTLAGTRTALSNKVATVKNLADRQDKLAGDVPEFVGACRKEAEAVARNDAEFAKLVTAVAADCEAKKVAATMLTAAEHLSNSAADKALPLETTALAQLKEFQAALNKWRAADATAKAQQLEQVLEQDKEKMEKLKALQAKVVDAIRQTEQQKDKSQKPTEELAQDLADLKGNMAEVLLKIATDLQVFPELPVGNDLVSDVNQIYEEVKQVEGSEAAKATELGLQKEDWILAELAKATDRLDDMEMWLVSAPDAVKRNTEAFDKTELPQIPVIPMASEVEDIIGDLLEQEKKEEEKSDDSAGNQGTADIAAGWGIAEGEFTSYAAKGKSGNERPDHKEQDGRSLVGRQGQSDGETTAGSGKVNEGDKNIEARRTQDSAQSGEVQEEGHSESKATGGGKLSGFGDRLGMAGNGPRRDANTTQGSELGMQAMLRRNAESLYAKASLAHLRTGSMDEVARHMRSAEEALAKGYPIREVREYQRRAILALKRTQAELDPGVSIDVGGETPRAGPPVDDQVAGAPDEAPAQYRDLVSDYFKSLNEVQP